MRIVRRLSNSLSRTAPCSGHRYFRIFFASLKRTLRGTVPKHLKTSSPPASCVFLCPNPQLCKLISDLDIKKPAQCAGFQMFLRRKRDSNPRYLSVRWFSRPVHSTTLPFLRWKACCFPSGRQI